MIVPRNVDHDALGQAGRAAIEALLTSAVPRVAPAISVAIHRQGSPVYAAAFGWLDPETKARPLRPATLFDLASLSKPFTATAFLSLVSKGHVELDDPVSRVIPAFAAGAPRRVDGGQSPLDRRILPVPPDRSGWTVDPASVTFRQLLTHTSGMAPWRSVFEAAMPTPEASARSDGGRRQAGLSAVYAYPFVARPGEEVHYSDLGFMVLGEAISGLSGLSLEVAIDRSIRRPLALSMVAPRPLAAGVPRELIAPTSIDADRRHRRCWGEVEDENADALGGLAGHAGLFASAADVAAFGEAWRVGDVRLGIDAGTMSAATMDQTSGLSASRGLGWQLPGPAAPYLEPFGPAAYGHTGFTGTSIVVDPTRDLVVVALTNRVYAGRTHPGVEDFRLALHAICARLA